MPKIDPPQLVRQAQELVAESKEICERSRRAVNDSKRLQKALGFSHNTRMVTRSETAANVDQALSRNCL